MLTSDVKIKPSVLVPRKALFWLNVVLISSVSHFAIAEVNSLREVYGIDAPGSNSDLADEYEDRMKQDDLAPKLNADIPEAAARDSGPRILVKRFVFQNIREYPELGITAEGVNAEAERLRSQYMKEEQLLDGGFTIDESAEVIEYLQEVGREGEVENITYEDMQNLVGIVRQHNRNRGLSFADLEEVTTQLSLYYRQRGLFLARVQLPAQEIKNGIVFLTVMEGVLGQVEALNSNKYSESTLRSPLENEIGRAVSGGDIEESLYILNDLPGLNITGAFTAGDNPGETKLKLTVREEEAFKFLFRVDNHGSEFTGDTRFFTSMEWYNPIGFGDSLRLGYLRSEDLEGNNEAGEEAHADLGQFSYSFPVFGLRTRLGLSADFNKYSIIDENGGIINELDLEGESSNFAINLNHQFIRSLEFNFSSGLALTDKKTTIDSELIPAGDHVIGGELNFYVDGLSRTGLRMLNIANVTLQYGEHQNEVIEGRDDTFFILGVDTNSLFFLPIPFTSKYSRLITTLKMQHSEASLPSFEQFSMGGPSGVRSFSNGEFSADQSVYLGNEWYFDLPDWSFFGGRYFNEVFQAGLLLDFAYGTQNGGFVTDSGALADDEWAQMSAAGLVFKAAWGDTFNAKLSIATPLEASSSLDPDSDDNSATPLNNAPDAIEVYADINFVF
ncbi:MAG: ShlB/FhaC/HecB family hemolysin secretion/activation protein [Thalassolituus sp.]